MPKRLMLLLAALVTSLAMACASTTPDGPPASPDTAKNIIGSWSGGETKITFTDETNFTWETKRPCATEPCPVSTKAGTYQLRRDQVHFAAEGEGDKAYSYTMSASPRALNLKAADGTEYKLQ